jgi:hypothetical protein
MPQREAASTGAGRNAARPMKAEAIKRNMKKGKISRKNQRVACWQKPPYHELPLRCRAGCVLCFLSNSALGLNRLCFCTARVGALDSWAKSARFATVALDRRGNCSHCRYFQWSKTHRRVTEKKGRKALFLLTCSKVQSGKQQKQSKFIAAVANLSTNHD